MPDVNGQPIFLSAPSVEYKGAEPLYDAAGNGFMVTSEFEKSNNNNTWLVLRKVSPTGALLDSWRLLLTGYKTAGNPGLANRDTTLVVTNAVYQAGVAADVRSSAVMKWELAGVFVVAATPPPPQPGPTITLPNVVAGTYQKIG